MSKIYIVTSGDYSDYGINAVFSTREKANAFAGIDEEHPEYGRYDYRQVEEWDIDLKVHFPRPGMETFTVVINVEDANITYNKGRGESSLPSLAPLENVSHYAANRISPERLIMQIQARDDVHAAKIASERRIAWILQQEAKG